MQVVPGTLRPIDRATIRILRSSLGGLLHSFRGYMFLWKKKRGLGYKRKRKNKNKPLEFALI